MSKIMNSQKESQKNAPNGVKDNTPQVIPQAEIVKIDFKEIWEHNIYTSWKDKKNARI